MKIFGIYRKILFVVLLRQAFSTSTSVTHRTRLFDREFFIKRDDLLTLECNKEVFGNKARKLLSLSQLSPFPNLVVSYGGAQGNAMRALALLCQSKNSKLVYLTRPIPEWMKKNPTGNFADSISAGMQHIELSTADYEHLAISKTLSPELLNRFQLPVSTLFVTQGAAFDQAKPGIDQLSGEIADFVQGQASRKPWKIFFATGTGISAYYAARYFSDHDLSDRIEVIAVPCVGFAAIIANELFDIHTRINPQDLTSTLPTVMSTENAPSRQFAKPYKEHYEIWQELQRQTEIEFDLTYAPRAFEVILSQCCKEEKDIQKISWKDLYPGYNLMYYHCGGMEGNASQLQRYKYLKLISTASPS